MTHSPGRGTEAPPLLLLDRGGSCAASCDTSLPMTAGRADQESSTAAPVEQWPPELPCKSQQSSRARQVTLRSWSWRLSTAHTTQGRNPRGSIRGRRCCHASPPNSRPHEPTVSASMDCIHVTCCRAKPDPSLSQTDRQTVLIGTRTHTPPDSISSRLRLHQKKQEDRA